ncbi:MAG: hypothetical protein B6I29_02390 [Marinitoga sp. 4572_148]|nr:MAG: hypothetical protein B6I29_02390 [Marinitoga sp. 4572_148]
MQKLGKFIIKYSKSIFFVMFGVTIISIFLTASLQIRPGFLDLLPDDDPYVKIYQKAIENFKSVDSVIIGIEGEKKDIINYIESVSSELREIQYIDAIYYKNPIDFISKNIFVLAPDSEQKFLKKLYTSNNLEKFFEALNSMFEEPEGGYKITEQDRKQFEYMLKSLNNFFEGINSNDAESIKNNLKNLIFGPKYLISKDGSFGMIVIKPTISSKDIEKVVELVNEIENIVKEKAKQYNINAGLTGTLVIARDEMVVSERDMAVATTVSLILILIIFILGFRSFRYMLLAVVPLVLGIIWALGFTKVAIGSLNIITVMMGAILVGLGIDYSIHIISLFIELKNKGFSTTEALMEVFKKNIRGVVVGAITTAIGMGIFAISSFPGFREFGIVLSSGIIFTMLAAIFGLTLLLKKYGDKYKNPGKAFVLSFNVEKYRIFPLVVLVVLIVLSILKIPEVEFDKNMMNIEAKGLESLRLNQEILDKFEFSPDNTIFISDDPIEVKDLYDKLKNLNVFSEIDSIVAYIPDTESQIERLKNANEVKKVNFDNNEFDLKRIKSEINKMSFSLSKAALSLSLIGEKELSEELREIIKSGILIKISNKNAEDLQKIQEIIIEEISKWRSNINDNTLIGLENLPDEIKQNYLGNKGMILTTAYSNGDMWNSDYQKKYFEALEKLNIKNVSGTALVFLRVIQISAKEGGKILLLTIIFIFIVLLFDMKSFKYAILAMLPMILSIVLMLGVMGWFGIKFNVVNIIALPLIIGIGVDDGIHLIHRYRRENNINIALKSTGKAITMTTLTTGAAFGSLVLAKYRGFIGFGLLLLLGVFFSYLITVFVVTSILSYIEPGGKNMKS